MHVIWWIIKSSSRRKVQVQHLHYVSLKGSILFLQCDASQRYILLLQVLIRLYPLYLELNFLSSYSGDKKVPRWLLHVFTIWLKVLKTLPFFFSGGKYIQTGIALWRRKIHSGTSTISRSVIWMSQKFHHVKNSNKSSTEPKKGVYFS